MDNDGLTPYIESVGDITAWAAQQCARWSHGRQLIHKHTAAICAAAARRCSVRVGRSRLWRAELDRPALPQPNAPGPRWPVVARNGHGGAVTACLLSGAKRKASTRDGYFAFWPEPELAPTTSVAMKSSAPRRRHYGQMVGVAPPSTRNVVPVMKSLRGLAIMQTAKAMSLASPILPTVWRRTFLMAKSRPIAGS